MRRRPERGSVGFDTHEGSTTSRQLAVPGVRRETEAQGKEHQVGQMSASCVRPGVAADNGGEAFRGPIPGKEIARANTP